MPINPPHKSHNAPDKYPTMRHFVAEMCTCVHISVTKWCIVGYETGALWDFWDGSLAWLLMPCLLESPDLPQPSYRLCWAKGSLSSRGRNSSSCTISALLFCGYCGGERDSKTTIEYHHKTIHYNTILHCKSIVLLTWDQLNVHWVSMGV